MSEVEKQHVDICLLKLNLADIEKELIAQQSAFSVLDAENQQKHFEAVAAFHTARSYHDEIINLKQKDAELTAQRLQLKRHTDELTKYFKIACKHRDTLTEALKQEKREIEIQVRKYEESLQEKAERFRSTRKYYDEEEVNKEMKEVNTVIAELEEKLGKEQKVVDELWATVENIHSAVPDKLLDIIGKQDLEEKLKKLSEKHESLVGKQ